MVGMFLMFLSLSADEDIRGGLLSHGSLLETFLPISHFLDFLPLSFCSKVKTDLFQLTTLAVQSYDLAVLLVPAFQQFSWNGVATCGTIRACDQTTAENGRQ